MDEHFPQLPDAVTRQAKAAEDIQRKLITGQNPPAGPTAGNTAPAAPAFPIETIVVNPQLPNPPALTPPAVPATPPPTETPVVIPPGVEIPQTCPNCEKQEQRYRVLQGKYNKEVPTLTYRVAYLENVNADLMRENTALKAAAQAAPPAPPVATPPPAASSIADTLKNSQDEKVKNFRENFPDIFDFVIQAVDQVAKSTQDQANKRLADMEKDSITRKQDAFLKRMNETHPDWQAICQTDPNWPQWLMRKERYSSSTRIDLLKAASERLDPEPIVNMLADFKAEFHSPAPVPSNPNPPAPPSINPPPQAPGNERFISPPSGPGAPPPPAAQPADAPITRAFIKQFYQDKARGNTAPYGGPQGIAQWEAKINQAAAQGRIIAR